MRSVITMPTFLQTFVVDETNSLMIELRVTLLDLSISFYLRGG